MPYYSKSRSYVLQQFSTPSIESEIGNFIVIACLRHSKQFTKYLFVIEKNVGAKLHEFNWRWNFPAEIEPFTSTFIPSNNVRNTKRISYTLLDCHSFTNATWYMEHLLKSNYVSFTSCQLQLQSYTPVNEVVKIILRRGLRNVMSHFIHFIFNTILHQICPSFLSSRTKLTVLRYSSFPLTTFPSLIRFLLVTFGNLCFYLCL